MSIGNTHSSTMRDTGLDVKGQVSGEDIVNCVDSVDFTVLEVDTPTLRVGPPNVEVSTNNAKRENYRLWTVADTYLLDLQVYNALYDARMGWGCETVATVYPANFDYPGNDLTLDRDAAACVGLDRELQRWGGRSPRKVGCCSWGVG